MGALFTIDPASLTEEQVAARNLIIRWQITSLQNAWQQYELGLLPQDVWQQVENRIRSRWESCYTRILLLILFRLFGSFLKRFLSKTAINGLTNRTLIDDAQRLS